VFDDFYRGWLCVSDTRITSEEMKSFPPNLVHEAGNFRVILKMKASKEGTAIENLTSVNNSKMLALGEIEHVNLLFML
jgi:hypothetical protein